MAYDKAKTHTRILKSSEIHTATASYSQIIRVPFFLLFYLNKETPNKKGKRVLLGYLELWLVEIRSMSIQTHPAGGRRSCSLGFRNSGFRVWSLAILL